MRKYKLFLVVALIAATSMMLTSCSKEKRIEGKWKVTRASGEFSDDKGSVWTFKESGDVTFQVDEYEYDGTWYVSGDELTIEYRNDEENVDLTGEFSIDDISSREMSLSGKWIDKHYETEYGEYSRVTNKYNVSYYFEKK